MNTEERHENWLIELESRIALLELAQQPSFASMEMPVESKQDAKETEPPPYQQYQQLKGQVLYLQGKLNDVLIKKGKSSKKGYKQYE